MHEVIKIEQRNGIEVVSARELWEKLESGQKFADWIKGRIEDFGFIEGDDYFLNLGKTPTAKGGRPTTEYYLTIDAAKEFCMLEGNEYGKRIRKYFIDCEKKLKRHDLAYLKTRMKSLDARRKFTDELKDHGYTKQHEYIQTTTQMKAALNIQKKKDEMSRDELDKVTAAEIIAGLNMRNSNAQGYRDVNPICVRSSIAVDQATRQRIGA